MTARDEKAARLIAGPCEYTSTPCSGFVREASKCVRCRMVPEIAEALAAVRAEEREACAKIALMHVCRLFSLPCVGKAVEGQECGCVVSSRIAREIRERQAT